MTKARRPVLVVLCCLVSVASVAGESGGGEKGKPADEAESLRHPSVKPTRNTYVVAPTGSDSNVGTQAAPWRTVRKATQTLKPGDAVYIRTGVYEEVLVPRRSGTEGNNIIYAAFPGEKPVIDCKNVTLPAWGGPVDIKRKSYIVISGLTVKHAQPHDNSTGIFAEHSDHLIIEHNIIEDSAASGIGTWNCSHVLVDNNEIILAGNGGGQEAMSIAITEHFEVRNNHLHHCKREGIDVKEGSRHGSVHHNYMHHIERQGIYVDAWDKHTFDIEIYANVTHDCNHAYAFASEMGGLLEDVRFYNNIAYNCTNFAGAVSDWGGSSTHPLKDIYITNNTFHNNGGGFQLICKEATNIVVRNNIFSANKHYQLAATPEVPREQYVVIGNLYDGPSGGVNECRGTQPLTGRPAFAAPDKGDFRLLGNSPAIDRGVRDGAPELDFAGNPRPWGRGVDLGAFEFGSRKRVAKKARAKPAPNVRRPRPVRLVPMPGAVEEFDGMLEARMREALDAGRTPGLYLSALRSRARVISLKRDRTLALKARGTDMTMAWSRLSIGDRKSLAIGLVRDGNPVDHSVAAFYLIADGDREGARTHLAQCGDFAASIEGFFVAETPAAADRDGS